MDAEVFGQLQTSVTSRIKGCGFPAADCVGIKDMAYLSLFIDPNDARGGLMRGGDKDGLSTDAVHVDAHSCFQIIHVDVAVFGDQVDNAMFDTNLNMREIG